MEDPSDSPSANLTRTVFFSLSKEDRLRPAVVPPKGSGGSVAETAGGVSSFFSTDADDALPDSPFVGDVAGIAASVVVSPGGLFSDKRRKKLIFAFGNPERVGRRRFRSFVCCLRATKWPRSSPGVRGPFASDRKGRVV